MSFRTVFIESPCHLYYQSGYLVVRKEEETTKLHLSEVSSVVLQTMQVNISAYLLSEIAKNKIEDMHLQVSSAITSLSYQMNAEYVFGLEWDLRQYLKGFKYQANRPTDESLIDNLIQFIDYCVDMHMTRPLMFFNLKTFLNEKGSTHYMNASFSTKFRCFCLKMRTMKLFGRAS